MALRYPELFTPFKIGALEVKNRVCMSGMHNIGWKDSASIITDNVLDYFEARAKGGVGLIFTGAELPSLKFEYGEGFVSSFDRPDLFIAQFKKLADRVHCYGTKLFIQIAHGGGRVDFPPGFANPPIAADESQNRWEPSIHHRAMTKDEIQQLIDMTIEAAKVAAATTCDGIDINAYGGYLLDQFLQPCFNKRDDEYAGIEGGIKIMTAIVQGIKAALGKKFPVTCRIGVRQHIKAEGKGGLPEENYEEYGRTPEQSIAMAKKLVEAGYDAIYLGNGTYDSFYWLYPPMYQKEGLWLDDVAALTKELDVPVICGGKILDPQMANDAIKDGKVTAIAMGRQLLADPEWANKSRVGEPEAIRPCIGCNFGCIGHIFAGLPQMCAVNANLFREADMDYLKPATQPKKVAVIGGGIAGMECARIAAKRGHDVTIYEKSNELGGMFIAAAVAENKPAERQLLKWYERELEVSGVNVKFGTELTAKDIEALDCDEVVVSTGSNPKLFPIPGIDDPANYEPIHVFRGWQTIPEGSSVAIIGGGLVGCELALWLKQEKGFTDVTIIEGRDTLMLGGSEAMPLPNRLMVEDELEFNNVKLEMNTMLTSIEGHKINVTTNGEARTIEADAVVVALGSAANDSLYRELYATLPKKVWLLGDAKQPSNIMFGIRDANAIAREI